MGATILAKVLWPVYVLLLILFLVATHNLICSIIRSFKYKNRILVDVSAFKGCIDKKVRRHGCLQGESNFSNVDGTLKQGMHEKLKFTSSEDVLEIEMEDVMVSVKSDKVYKQKGESSDQSRHRKMALRPVTALGTNDGTLSTVASLDNLRVDKGGEGGQELRTMTAIQSNEDQGPLVEARQEIWQEVQISMEAEEGGSSVNRQSAAEGSRQSLRTPLIASELPTFTYRKKTLKELDFNGLMAAPTSQMGIKVFNYHILQFLSDVLVSVLLISIFVWPSAFAKRMDIAAVVAGLICGSWLVTRVLGMGLTSILEGSGVVDSLNSLCQRNGIVYFKEERVTEMVPLPKGSPVNQEFPVGGGDSQPETPSFKRPGAWHALLWLVPKSDSRREVWSKHVGLGIQYSNALEAHDEALAHVDVAATSLAALCGLYVFGTLSTIALKLMGSYIFLYPGSLVGVLVTFATAIITGNAVTLISYASAAIKEQRAVNTCTDINDGACIVSPKSLAKYVTGSNPLRFCQKAVNREFRPAWRVWCHLQKREIVLWFRKCDDGLFLRLKVIPTHEVPRRHRLLFDE